MQRLFTLFLLLVALCSTHAQKVVTVLDLDTRLPIKGVSVKVDGREFLQTDYLGHVTVSDLADTISFSHIKYERETLLSREVGDTMYLLPLEHQLDEVVVIGNDKLIKNMLRDVSRDASLYGVSGGLVTFDFGRLIDRRARRDSRHKKQASEILLKWDAAPIYK